MAFAKNLQKRLSASAGRGCKKNSFFRLTAGGFVAIILKLYDSLAQLAEHLTFNQGVRSSNLRWVTKRVVNALYAGVAQLVEQLICNQQVRGSSPFTSSTDKEVEGGCLSSFIQPRVWIRTRTLRGFCRLENLPVADFQTKTARRLCRKPWRRVKRGFVRSPAPYPEEFPSGQRGQTVNLLRLASVVRIHPPPPSRRARLF